MNLISRVDTLENESFPAISARLDVIEEMLDAIYRALGLAKASKDEEESATPASRFSRSAIKHKLPMHMDDEEDEEDEDDEEEAPGTRSTDASQGYVIVCMPLPGTIGRPRYAWFQKRSNQVVWSQLWRATLIVEEAVKPSLKMCPPLVGYARPKAILFSAVRR